MGVGQIVFPEKSTTIVYLIRNSPNNIHKGKIIQTEQVIFRNKYVYTFVHTITTNKNVMNLKENKEAYMAGYIGNKKKKFLHVCYREYLKKMLSVC